MTETLILTSTNAILSATTLISNTLGASGLVFRELQVYGRGQATLAFVQFLVLVLMLSVMIADLVSREVGGSQ